MKTAALALSLLFMPVATASAQEPPASFQPVDTNGPLVDEDGVALQGYDPVLYHIGGKAMKGRPKYTVEYEGATYYFAMPANRIIFLEAPERYAPAYGGWCALGLGMEPGTFEGRTPGRYPADPHTFTFIDGRLHFFFNADGFNAFDHWNEAVHKPRADSLWQVLKQAPAEADS